MVIAVTIALVGILSCRLVLEGIRMPNNTIFQLLAVSVIVPVVLTFSIMGMG